MGNGGKLACVLEKLRKIDVDVMGIVRILVVGTTLHGMVLLRSVVRYILGVV